jgi:hypothetical protein
VLLPLLPLLPLVPLLLLPPPLVVAAGWLVGSACNQTAKYKGSR